MAKQQAASVKYACKDHIEDLRKHQEACDKLVDGGQVRQRIAQRRAGSGPIVRLMRNNFKPLPDYPVSTYEAERLAGVKA